MNQNPFNRRTFLKTSSNGFGYLAFAALAQQQALRAAGGGPLAPKASHFPARAKHVIFLCMQGAPSHVDLLDYKPKLIADHGKSAPSIAGRNGQAKLMRSPWKFSQHGRSGLWISELLPGIASHADDLCILNSMATDVPAHPQAFSQLHTGTTQFVRPSLGAWALYGLGTMNENLPGFITVNPPANATRTFGSAFLPAIYQGTKLGGSGLPGGGALARRFGMGADNSSVANIKNNRYSTEAQRTQLDLVQALNQSRMKLDGGVSPEVEGVIESYELAFRMQTSVPEATSIDTEPPAVRALYGPDVETPGSFARNCLVARRLAEKGVRFIQLYHPGWDSHGALPKEMTQGTREVDAPAAGLLEDLRNRDMLKDTLVVFCTEFGRTCYSQGSIVPGDLGNGVTYNYGREHHRDAFTIWMAGGGIRPGTSYGQTCDLGIDIVKDPVGVNDFHATLLHLLGIDHLRLTYPFQGRDFRLTDVGGKLVKGILA